MKTLSFNFSKTQAIAGFVCFFSSKNIEEMGLYLNKIVETPMQDGENPKFCYQRNL